jgi:hypothetical protein
MMITRVFAITLTVLFAVASLTAYANAGASASAPSKNTRSSQLASQQKTNEFGITEYSSSSARTRSHHCSTTSYC